VASPSESVVGREPELAAIEQLFARARESFSALLLEGDAGIGKTTVFREGLGVAAADGFQVLTCRPGASETTLSFAAVGDLLDAIPADRWGALPSPQRRALDVAMLRTDADEIEVDQRAIAAGLRSLVTGLAAEQPVLLAVDDVQWVDPASAMILGFVLRRLGPERVALLATRRLSEATGLDLGTAVPAGALARTQLGPLSLGALQRVLRERLGVALPRSTLVRVQATSHGNPFFALEIARVLAERGNPPAGEPLPVPDDIRELVRARVEGLPDATRELLLAAASLAEPTVKTLRRAFDRSLDSDLEPAERAGIARLEGAVVAFAHPLHAAGVIATATSSERQRMHRRLAEALDSPEERARHLAFGAEEADEAVAKLLEEGAGAARARGGLHSAAELLERARSLTPSGQAESARGRGIRAAELHIHAGDRAHARSLLQELLGEGLSSAQRAETLRLLAELSISDEDVPAAERQLVEALEHTSDRASAARIETELAYVVSHRMDFARAAEYSHQSLASLAGSSDGPLLAEALAYCANADLFAGRGVDWTKVNRALELEDHDRVGLPGLPPSGVAALIMMFVGRHEAARELLGLTLTRLAERGDEVDLGHALIWMSWLETRCGNFARAAEVADEAITRTSLTGSYTMNRWAVAQRAWVDAHLGDVDGARRRCAEARPQHMRGVAQIDIWISATGALLELSVGDPHAAWEASRTMTEAVEQQGIGEPIPLVFLPDALEALVALGHLERAEPILEVFERRGRELDREWALATAARCRGLLMAARGDLTAALKALDDALAQHERIELPFDRARTQLVRGVTQRRARRRAQARSSLEEARGEFERMGAALWAGRASEELDRLGGRKRRDRDDLTPSERRVVELAAGGLSNKEISSKLVVSVHTVEVHLSHTYAKLGIRSRSQLAARLTAKG